MEIESEIDIHARAEVVWSILTDLSGFPNWNPFIRRASGILRPNDRLAVFIEPSGARGMEFKPVVLRVDPNRELRWLGHLIIPGLFDGEHIFMIEPTGSGTVRFRQREIFSGLLVPVVMPFLAADTRRGFHEMNQKLKELAEGR